ncbi:MAG: GIY-YIG nuclease family protein [Patescibacteria group bacterium]|jgi:putative endonuclease
MKYYVYILQSQKDNSLYKGITNNLERRIREHNNKQNRSTKNKVPYELIYYETFSNRLDARNREKYFKSGSGREFINSIIIK